MMGLQHTVLQPAVTPELDAPLQPAVTPGLEAALEQLVQEARLSFPTIELPSACFIAFLTRHASPKVADCHGLLGLRAGELYLVCAYGLGDRQAHDIIESLYLPKVHQALQRRHTGESVRSDIEQDLRVILLEMNDPAVTRWGYSGRSELAGWLCLCAIRKAASRNKRDLRELGLKQIAQKLEPEPSQDPETQLLLRRFLAEFRQISEKTLAAMSGRERNLLRYHELQQLSIDKIALIYQVHRATAARWVARARTRYIYLTRTRLSARLKLSRKSLRGLLVLLDSHASLQLGAYLLASPEPEAASDFKLPVRRAA